MSPDGATIAMLHQGARAGAAMPFTIELFDVRTGTFRTWRGTAATEPLSAGQRDSIADDLARKIHDAKGGSAASYRPFKAKVVKALAVPSAFPVATQIFVSNEGCVWLERPRRAPSGGRLFDLHDTAGKRIMQIALPPRTLVMSVGCREGVAVSVDEDDIPTVVLLSIP